MIIALTVLLLTLNIPRLHIESSEVNHILEESFYLFFFPSFFNSSRITNCSSNYLFDLSTLYKIKEITINHKQVILKESNSLG